jgi:carbonic anhydrase/acetyltransferase-like protein (isoleucine patch superfamily)
MSGLMTVVGKNVTVGHMLDGAVIESGAMVAAGSLIAPGKVVRRGELWAGNPGRKLRDLTEKDYENFKRVVEGYVRLSRTYGPDVEVRQAAE